MLEGSYNEKNYKKMAWNETLTHRACHEPRLPYLQMSIFLVSAGKKTTIHEKEKSTPQPKHDRQRARRIHRSNELYNGGTLQS